MGLHQVMRRKKRPEHTHFFNFNQPATCDYDKDAVPVWVRYNVGLDGRMAVLGQERE
jgi:hypothetical protein